MAVQGFYQYTHSACRILVAALLILMTAISALAAPKPNGATANAPVFPGTLPNAQYVYVAPRMEIQFDPNPISS